ncbi:Peptidase C1-like family protein [Legionella massiliensis]|uniref:Peptidase C1-like family protein n=1 Tax=Legionella massiliensis TaxID=1034943 RepID=A0A078KPC7_9GAMM|nr:C1 family peptidase [Legionella massiliensis]CDZ76255.1 Peptidase C1-like family protein [Legionella massiliensis]CEE11993.1 Peptidase C1-like family protein [Legionella massiliensis]
MKISHFALISATLSGSLFAQDIKIVGTITQPIKPSPSVLSATKTGAPKQIKLLKVELSAEAKESLANKAKMALAHTQQFAANPSNSKYPSQVELGMNDVPVLNQGMYGTCVTFAVTAAIDAVLKKGDYLSQLCQLQLGNYLEKNAYSISGWEGSYGRVVLSQMDTFGIVPKSQEQIEGCGGLSRYPADGMADPDGAMSVREYHQLSESVADQVAWSPILDIFQTLADRVDTNKTLNEVKASLVAGDRVTFAVLLLDFDLGLVGAVGKNHAENDTWVLTPEIARDVYLNPNFGGHEMVITGYDDNAIAVDDQGREYRGLLTLRNSWGDKVGDKGDFYMSYDYFKLLVTEAQRIRDVSYSDD